MLLPVGVLEHVCLLAELAAVIHHSLPYQPVSFQAFESHLKRSGSCIHVPVRLI